MVTKQDVEQILGNVKFPGFKFHIRCDKGGNDLCLYATFKAVDNYAPGEPAEQTTRKWVLSRYMVRSEVVRTAFKCVLTALEHEARENFTYRGERVFGPHFDVEALFELARARRLEVRT